LAADVDRKPAARKGLALAIFMDRRVGTRAHAALSRVSVVTPVAPARMAAAILAHKDHGPVMVSRRVATGTTAVDRSRDLLYTETTDSIFADVRDAGELHWLRAGAEFTTAPAA
jgi:hypothetical protein